LSFSVASEIACLPTLMFIRAFLPMLSHDLPSKPIPDPQSSPEKG
jgi:hypothetical protein